MTTPLEAQYRSAVRGLFERLDLPGLTLEGRVHGPRLEDVYVELQAVAEMPEAAEDSSAAERRLLNERQGGGFSNFEQQRELDSLRYRRWKANVRQESPRQSPRSVESLVEDMRRPALVLLGDPGSGKSTLLRLLALRSTERLPILVPLAAYDECLRQAPLPLEEFLAVYHDKWRGLPGLGPLFQTALAEGRALVLLDGLDEVLTVETRRRVAEQVQALVKRWGEAGNRFVLTSRFIGYREVQLPPEMPHAMVVDFGPAEVERFVHQWFLALERQTADVPLSEAARARAQQREQRLLQELRKRPALAHLTTHPLLLTMLALMREEPGVLPTRRIALYAHYVDALVEGWRRQRSAGARTRRPEEWALGEVHARLMDVALWLHRHRPGGTASQADLVRALREGAALSEAQALGCLRELKELAGLLGERGRDAYGFPHLTFQEYFVGRALARLSPEARWELLRPHLHDPRWREPLLLCAGQLGTIEGKPEQAEALVQAILANGSEWEDVLHRDLFLAVAVLAEDVALSERLRDRLLSQLEAPRRSAVPSLGQRALEGVVHLLRLGHAPAEQRFLDGFWPDFSGSLQVLEKGLPDTLPEALRTPLLELLGDETPEVREDVGRVLAKAMERDARLRQALCALLASEDVIRRSEAVFLLEKWVGRDARVGPALLGHLADEDEYIRASIVRSMNALVEQDARARHALLVRLAEDPSPHVRETILKTLGAVVGTDEAVLLTLLGLDDASPSVRGCLCAVLVRHARGDARTKQALLLRLDSRHKMESHLACAGLRTWVKGDEEVRQALLARLGEAHDVRQAACEALSPLAASDARVRQALLVYLEDPDSDMRAAALSGLRTLPDHDATVVQAILLRLGDESGFVKWAASSVLNEWAGRDVGGVRRTLLDTLTHEDGTQREGAVRALSQSARNDAQVCPALLGLSSDEDDKVRGAVVHALGDLAGSDLRVRQALVVLLGDKEMEVRRAAFAKLEPLVGGDVRVRQALLGLLGAEDRWLSERVAQVLGTVADIDEQVRRTLFSQLDEEMSSTQVSWQVRVIASQALLKVRDRQTRERAIGWVLRALEPDLRPGFDNRGDHERASVATVLKKMEPLYRDERVLERLMRLMREDEKAYVRDAAYHAVSRLLVAPVERTGNEPSPHR